MNDQQEHSIHQRRAQWVMVTVPCWCSRCAGNRWSLNVASHMVWAGQCPCTALMHTVVSAQSLCTDPVKQTSLTAPSAPTVTKSKCASARYETPPIPLLFIAVHTNLKTRWSEKRNENTSKRCQNSATHPYNWITLDKRIISLLYLGALDTYCYISLISAASTVTLGR